MNSKKKVLVVDDAAENLQIMVEILKDKYAVVVSKTGERMMEIINKDPLPDIILLDVVLPDVSGYEICKRLKGDKRTQHIPVIYISGSNESKLADNIEKTGAVGYLIKPVEVDELYSKIQQYI